MGPCGVGEEVVVDDEEGFVVVVEVEDFFDDVFGGALSEFFIGKDVSDAEAAAVGAAAAGEDGRYGWLVHVCCAYFSVGIVGDEVACREGEGVEVGDDFGWSSGVYVVVVAVDEAGDGSGVACAGEGVHDAEDGEFAFSDDAVVCLGYELHAFLFPDGAVGAADGEGNGGVEGFDFGGGALLEVSAEVVDVHADEVGGREEGLDFLGGVGFELVVENGGCVPCVFEHAGHVEHAEGRECGFFEGESLVGFRVEGVGDVEEEDVHGLGSWWVCSLSLKKMPLQ